MLLLLRRSQVNGDPRFGFSGHTQASTVFARPTGSPRAKEAAMSGKKGKALYFQNGQVEGLSMPLNATCLTHYQESGPQRKPQNNLGEAETLGASPLLVQLRGHLC